MSELTPVTISIISIESWSKPRSTPTRRSPDGIHCHSETTTALSGGAAAIARKFTTTRTKAPTIAAGPTRVGTIFRSGAANAAIPLTTAPSSGSRRISAGQDGVKAASAWIGSTI